MLLSFLLSAVVAQAQPLDRSYYHARYALPDVFAKRVDNRGEGFEPLYGVRNFREVLRGVLYRGGANNMFHRDHRRDNMNPLPEDGLLNLCQEGFGYSVYLYTTNYETASPRVDCQGPTGAHRLKYVQLSPNSQPREILELVQAAIQDPARGPIYTHCWNGWHASGLISALALRQFCDWSPARALAYWEANVDGVNGPEYDPVRRRVQSFTPYADLQISAAEQMEICPR